MKRKKWGDEYWPVSIGDVRGESLRQLDDEKFQTLKDRIRVREKKQNRSKSHVSRLLRKLTITRRTEKRVRYTKDALLARHRDCEILDSFVANRKSQWRKLNKRVRGKHIECKNFSFIDNPIETYEILRKITQAECEVVNLRIDFTDPHVLDIAPYMVFGLMRERMAPLTSGGNVTGPIIKVLEAVGLREFLKMRPFGRVPMDDVWPFPLRQRRKAGTTNSKNIAMQPTTVEITADSIAEQVNSWLQKIDPPAELTEYGAGHIKGMVGEILNNAERHSKTGGDGEWITAGFMARRNIVVDEQKRSVHICHLCFFSPGRSISETISEGPQDIVEQIQRYQAKHQKSKISMKSLATVFALQDGISRVQQGQGQPTGGTGLMDVVEFANEVGGSNLPNMNPKVAILSGNTYIRFDAPYLRGISAGTDSRRLQWFNAANSVMISPDPKYVLDLPQRFPGTLITLRFVLDGSFEDGSE